MHAALEVEGATIMAQRSCAPIRAIYTILDNALARGNARLVGAPHGILLRVRLDIHGRTSGVRDHRQRPRLQRNSGGGIVRLGPKAWPSRGG